MVNPGPYGGDTMTMPTLARGDLIRRGAAVGLRTVTAAGLTVDAVVHLRIAGDYDRVGAQITEGTLFRVEAAVALFSAIFVLLSARWLAALIAAGVAASAAFGLLLSVYWDLGAIGPFPDLYEPIWFTEKVIAFIAETVSLLTALAALAVAIAWKRAGGQRSEPYGG
jgi:hypothetical protein